MSPVAGGGKLISIGDRIRFPDDVTVGFIIGEKLKSIAHFPLLTYSRIYRTFAWSTVNGSRSISFPSGAHGTYWFGHIPRSSKFKMCLILKRNYKIEFFGFRYRLVTVAWARNGM